MSHYNREMHNTGILIMKLRRRVCIESEMKFKIRVCIESEMAFRIRTYVQRV